MKSLHLLLLVTWIVCGGVASAVSIIDPIDRPTISAQDYRNEAARFPMVGAVTKSGGGFNGSGVLISDRWVLTAGHVADFKTGGTFSIDGASYQIERVVSHPFHTTLSDGENDIGLLYLSSAVTSIEAATMIHLDDPQSLIGREAVWVGHGLGGTGLTGQQAPFDVRAFTNVIDAFGSDPIYQTASSSLVSDFDRPDGSTNAAGSDPTATRLEGGLTSGDSGGGVFIEQGGKWFLVGINSYSATFTAGVPLGSYGRINGATSVQLFHEWIAAETGIRAVPEPHTAWLFGLASGLLWRRRRVKP